MKLTKRNYLGLGYVHQFKNNLTGEIVFVPCTKEEYKRMGEKDGSKYNPTKDGFTWMCSLGETIAVDSPDTMIKENEYCDYKGGHFVVLKNKDGRFSGKSLPLGKITSDEIADKKIKWQ